MTISKVVAGFCILNKNLPHLLPSKLQNFMWKDDYVTLQALLLSLFTQVCPAWGNLRDSGMIILSKEGVSLPI